MDNLRWKCNVLNSKYTNIKKEISRAEEYRKRPREEVLFWLEDIVRIEEKVKAIERSFIAGNTRSFSRCSPRRSYSKVIKQLTKEVDQLQETSKFSDGLVVSDELLGNSVGAAPTLVGNSIQRVLDEIWKGLMDSTVGIIGVHGIGGVGKTAAMMNINNRLATNKIFTKIIWVTFSKDLSLEKVQNDIAMQLNVYLPTYEKIISSSARLLESLNKVKKLLVIFDDMWEPISLEKVGIPLPQDKKDCKIVLTTRSRDICSQMKTDKYIEIKVLSENEAWDLFVSKAGGKVLAPDVQPIAIQMVRKCDYLPILIISLGHAMQDEVKIEVWMKASKELSSSVTMVHGWEEKNLQLLRFSYSRLKNDEVRQCFLYCAFFPEDYLFEPNELIRYWIAEHFISDHTYMVTQIDEGLEILKELKDASMLEIFTKRGHERLKMHDLFRDLAANIVRDEPGFLVKAGLGLKEPPYFWEWADSTKISLIRNRINILDDLDYHCPNVSTLLLQDNPLSLISPTFFNPMSALQILDISYSGIKELPSSLCRLANLQVLFLQHCWSLKKIPSLEYLKELQILSLRGTFIKELPHGIKELVSLRSLDLSETTKLEYIHVGLISSLSSLQELCLQGSHFFTMESPLLTNCIKELRCLKRLEILTLSTVGFIDHLDTIMCLREQNLTRFSINVFGSTGDFFI